MVVTPLLAMVQSVGTLMLLTYCAFWRR